MPALIECVCVYIYFKNSPFHSSSSKKRFSGSTVDPEGVNGLALQKGKWDCEIFLIRNFLSSDPSRLWFRHKVTSPSQLISRNEHWQESKVVDFGLPPSRIFCNSRWKVLKIVTMFLFVITLRTSVSTAFKIKLSLFFMHEFLSKTQGPVENKSPKEMFLCWFIYRIV